MSEIDSSSASWKMGDLINRWHLSYVPKTKLAVNFEVILVPFKLVSMLNLMSSDVRVDTCVIEQKNDFAFLISLLVDLQAWNWIEPTLLLSFITLLVIGCDTRPEYIWFMLDKFSFLKLRVSSCQPLLCFLNN